MSLTTRGDTWVADLREMGGPRQSLFTRNKDHARVLHNELEQRVLKGEKINGRLTRALLQALESPRATSVSSMVGLPTQAPRAVEARGVAGLTLQKAFDLTRVEREEWRSSKDFKSIQGNYSFVSAHFGSNKPLDEITSTDVTNYKAQLITQGLSPSTINQRLSILSVLFDTAEELEYPVIKPRIKFVKVRPGRKRIVSRSEEMDAVEWFKASAHKLDAHMADLVVCLVDTGFRLSEMLNLDKGGVQWENNRVLAWETKADLPRAVPMTTRVRGTLERRFKTHDGAPFGMLDVFKAADRWSVMRKAKHLGADKQFVLHALRHTTATRLAAAGVDAFKIQQWMGHKQIATTQIYVNLAAHHLGSLGDVLEQFGKCVEVVKFDGSVAGQQLGKTLVHQSEPTR